MAAREQVIRDGCNYAIHILPATCHPAYRRMYVDAEPGCSEDVSFLLAAFVEANREGILADLQRLDDA